MRKERARMGHPAPAAYPDSDVRLIKLAVVGPNG